MKSNKFDDFVRDIESYYLNLKGKGIMLSPNEYDMIVSWKSRSVPKELVMRGTRTAFEKGFSDDYNRKQKFRSLTQCADYVEELIREYKSTQLTDVNEPEHLNKYMIKLILDKLNRIIVSEKRDVIRKHYIKSREKILDLLKDDQTGLFDRIRQIEADFYEDLFQNMSEIEKKRLIEEAQAHLSKRIRFMTERARLESLISFRNELLIKEFKLINFNAID